jgi:hypothetical protein
LFSEFLHLHFGKSEFCFAYLPQEQIRRCLKLTPKATGSLWDNFLAVKAKEQFIRELGKLTFTDYAFCTLSGLSLVRQAIISYQLFNGLRFINSPPNTSKRSRARSDITAEQAFNSVKVATSLQREKSHLVDYKIYCRLRIRRNEVRQYIIVSQLSISNQNQVSWFPVHSVSAQTPAALH